MPINTAKDRAEEVWQNLQKRARDLLEAEEGLVATVRELIEDKGLTPAEVRKQLEDVLGRIKTAKIWNRLTGSNAVVALNDYRDEVEKKVEDTVRRLLGTFQIATKADLDALEKKFSSVNRKVNEINRKVKKLAA